MYFETLQLDTGVAGIRGGLNFTYKNDFSQAIFLSCNASVSLSVSTGFTLMSRCIW